jgi:hypothetical protein
MEDVMAALSTQLKESQQWRFQFTFESPHGTYHASGEVIYVDPELYRSDNLLVIMPLDDTFVFPVRMEEDVVRMWRVGEEFTIQREDFFFEPFIQKSNELKLKEARLLVTPWAAFGIKVLPTSGQVALILNSGEWQNVQWIDDEVIIDVAPNSSFFVESPFVFSPSTVRCTLRRGDYVPISIQLSNSDTRLELYIPGREAISSFSSGDFVPPSK